MSHGAKGSKVNTVSDHECDDLYETDVLAIREPQLCPLDMVDIQNAVCS